MGRVKIPPYISEERAEYMQPILARSATISGGA